MAHMHEEEPEKENGERWLLTYSDLITLLMAFFMVLYAMSQVDLKKFKALGGSLGSALHSSQAQGIGSGTGALMGSGGGPTPSPVQIQPIDPEFAAMSAKIQQYTTKEGLKAAVRISYDERGMVIQLSDNLLFPEGSAILTPQAKQILNELATVLAKETNHVRIEGHTDSSPIRTDRYPSNWQLSTDRATNVIMYWMRKGALPPSRLSAAGYGEFRPVAANDTPAHRALNRRVDVVILKNMLSRYEPKSQVTDAKSPGAGQAAGQPTAQPTATTPGRWSN